MRLEYLSEFLCITIEKLWKNDNEKDTCIYQDNESLSNIRLVYLPSRTTCHAQPLDMGFFAKLQSDFRVWLNSQLFDEKEPTKLECVLKTYELMASIPEDYTKACWKRTGLQVRHENSIMKIIALGISNYMQRFTD